jgi:hypothetical protein
MSRMLPPPLVMCRYFQPASDSDFEVCGLCLDCLNSGVVGSNPTRGLGLQLCWPVKVKASGRADSPFQKSYQGVWQGLGGGRNSAAVQGCYELWASWIGGRLIAWAVHVASLISPSWVTLSHEVFGKWSLLAEFAGIPLLKPCHIRNLFFTTFQ